MLKFMNNHNLESIYTEYYKLVYGLCLKITKDSCLAEDLAHDVFIQVHRKIDTFRGESSLYTWLHRLTVNQCLMLFRKSSFKSELLTKEGKFDASHQPIFTNSQSVNLDSLVLQSALKRLILPYRRVFLLYCLYGYTHKEISLKLNISVHTSKSCLCVARRQLKTILSSVGAE